MDEFVEIKMFPFYQEIILVAKNNQISEIYVCRIFHVVRSDLSVQFNSVYFFCLFFQSIFSASIIEKYNLCFVLVIFVTIQCTLL